MDISGRSPHHAPTHGCAVTYVNWIVIGWSMVAAVCLTLATIHLLAWFRARKQFEYLAFAATAAATGVVTLMEMSAMQSVSVEHMAAVHRWVHVPVVFVYAGQIMFVRLYFGAGRMGLGYTIIVVRVAVAVFSLLRHDGLYFTRIAGLRHVVLPGGQVIALPVGTLSPLHLLDVMTLAAILLFLLDAASSLNTRARSQARYRALLLAAAIGFFSLAVLVHVPALHLGLADLPYMVGWSFMPVIVVMVHSMSTDLLETARLSGELRLSEARLRESERRLTLAADAGGIALWMWDRGGSGLWCNDHARRLLDAAPEGPLDLQHFLANAHPDDMQQLEQSTLAASADESREFDLRVVLPGGGIRWLAVRGLVDGADSGAAGVVRGAAIDITVRRELEHESRTLRDELAHLSRVTMLGELSGAIAHELNQPLAAILSNAQAAQRFLVRGADALPEVEEILADIVAEDRRASEVICRLRTLLRKGELRLDDEGVNEMVEDVLKLLRSDLINRKVVLQTRFHAEEIIVRAARVQVQQVLVNLVINACDSLAHIAAPERRLVVSTDLFGDDFALITVADNGPGVPSGMMNCIFEPFVTTKEQGMGLGLAVCRTIVLAHGGQLWADADVVHGARLCFTLPLA